MASRTIFFAKKLDDDFVIDIFDFIGQDFFGEGVNAKTIAAALADARGSSRIIVRVNSPGGDVFEGLTIYNLLLDAEEHVRVEIHGLAASMASVIALAGDEVVMAEGAMYMIHNPWSYTVGDGNKMRKKAEMLDKAKSSLLGIYASSSNLARAKIEEMMDAETWMTAIEAVKFGFAHSMISDDESLAASAPQDRTFATLSNYNKVPPSLYQQLTSPDGLRLVAAMREPKKERKMDRDKIIQLLGLSATATDTEIETALAQSRAPAPAQPHVDLTQFVPRADYDALNARVQTTVQTLETQAKASFDAKVRAAVDKATVDGRITPASKQFHLETTLSAATKKDSSGKDTIDIEAGEAQLAKFLAYVGVQPVLVASSEAGENGIVAETTMASNTEMEVCKRLGVTKDELTKARADIKSNRENYPHEIYRFAAGSVG